MVKAISAIKLIELEKTYPNDKDLGKAFRKLLKDILGE